MSQKTLTNFGESGRTAGGSEMDRILNMDDAVDELSDSEVKDVWVRGQFAREIFRANSRLLASEESDGIEQRLGQMHSGVFKELAVRYAGQDSELAAGLSWEDDRENVRYLWDRWTKDDVENPVEAARERIKTALRGCGMPRINIMRDRVRYHQEG